MNLQSFGFLNPDTFHAYQKLDFDLESGNNRKPRKSKKSIFSPLKMIKFFGNKFNHFYKIHPILVFLLSLSFGIAIIIIFSKYENRISMRFRNSVNVLLKPEEYPFKQLHNLVMVAGHSVYTSNSCGKIEDESSWYLEPYQKNPGQAATFVEHIKVGVQTAAKDDESLLLFSGGETRKSAGPRSEAQSYWTVAEAEVWFGKKDAVRSRTLTEENARDSFENLLFSICRFRELTGTYPHNITVVSYDFKEERFSQLHRSALRFPENRFSFHGTPAPPASIEGAMKGEAIARAQFQSDPYGCFGTLHRKRVKRDPFHRIVPYPSGCPELKDLFNYCGPSLYSGVLPW